MQNMNISNNQAYGTTYTTGPYTTSYGDTYGDPYGRTIPVTSGISDAPDLTMPVEVCDMRPPILPYKKPGLGERISRRIYGDDDQIVSERFNAERYQKKHGLKHHNHGHDTHHTVGGSTAE
jgi:hypothetical protein